MEPITRIDPAGAEGMCLACGSNPTEWHVPQMEEATVFCEPCLDEVFGPALDALLERVVTPA